MKKGAIAIDNLAMIIAFLLVALALVIFFQRITEANPVDPRACEWSVALNAFKKSLLLGKDLVPPSCKVKRLEIDKSSIDSKRKKAEKDLNFFKNNDDYKKLLRYFSSEDSHIVDEYALDKIMADEMVECWDKVWRGKLSVFDEWWNLMECCKTWDKEPGSGSSTLVNGVDKVGETCIETEPCTGKTVFSALMPVYGLYEVASGELQFKQSPVFCIMCSRITFNDDIKNLGLPNKITSMYEWLYINRVKNTADTYYDHLMEGQTNIGQLAPQKYYYDIDFPYAIVFRRINVHKSQQFTDWALSYLGKAPSENINRLDLVPFDKVTTPIDQGGIGCTVLID